jgi:hypothetical protein
VQNNNSNKQLRSFGLIVGAGFALIGFWPFVLHGRDPRAWAFLVSALLILAALIYPKSLAPAQRGWMALGAGLGWFNTRLILFLTFYLLFLPFGLVMRLIGRDSMKRDFQPSADSYRITRAKRMASHMHHQY